MEKFRKAIFNNKEYNLPIVNAGKVGIAVFDSYSNIDMCRDAAKELCTKMEKENVTDFDAIIGVEIKGVAIAQRVSDYFKKPMIVFRKNKKVNFFNPVEVSVETVTSGLNKLYIDKSTLESLKGKRCIIVDDVVSSGSTVNAIEEALVGFDISIPYKAFVFKESDDYQKPCIYVDKLDLYPLD